MLGGCIWDLLTHSLELTHYSLTQSLEANGLAESFPCFVLTRLLEWSHIFHVRWWDVE